MFGSETMLFTAIKDAAGGFWHRYIAAEDPDTAGERLHQQRIDDFTLFADLLAAMRSWERERGLEPHGFGNA
jgi:hypothetical protein